MDLRDILVATGLPVTEIMWHPRQPPPLPYLVLVPGASNDFVADNANYLPVTRYDIELYSSRRDRASETQVETALATAEIPYTKTSNWIERESMHQVVYAVQVQGG